MVEVSSAGRLFGFDGFLFVGVLGSLSVNTPLAIWRKISRSASAISRALAKVPASWWEGFRSPVSTFRMAAAEHPARFPSSAWVRSSFLRRVFTHVPKDSGAFSVVILYRFLSRSA
jgi:hypothetical protein